MATAASAPRQQVLLYTGDWSGTRQIYAVRGTTLAQLTRTRPARCPSGSPCGHERVVPSPDGRRVAYWDFVAQSTFRWQLFVAAADGSAPRRVAVSTNFLHDADWAPDSARLAYAGSDGIHVVRANGSGDTRVSRSAAGGRHRAPRWAPNGRRLAYATDTGVVVLDGGFRRVATIAGDDFAWSPSGRWLAVRNDDTAFVVRADGSGRRLLAHDVAFGPVSWSVGDRYLAFRHRAGIAIATRATGALRELDVAGEYAWSPTHPSLAIGATDRLLLVRPGGGPGRVLARERAEELAWAPDGRSLAYLACAVCAQPFWSDRDLRIATVGGAVRTVVPTAGRAGGSIAEPRWTRSPRSTRYRPVAPRLVAVSRPDGIRAPLAIDLVAANAGSVAYASCGHAFVWTPATGTIVEPGSTSLTPRCNSPSYYAGYGLTQLALAGDRVASTWVGGGNTTSWWLGATSIPTGATATLGEGSATTGGGVPWRGALAGLPAGAGDLLVFSTWTEARDPGSTAIRVTSQTVRRAPESGCPCPDLAASPGPFVPYDVAQGRVVAGGDNETRVYDGLGALLVSVPISPAAAQLDGSDLVIAVRGTLRVHDAATGVLRHGWSLPDAPVAAPCARLACRRDAASTLVLEDVARGLTAYTLNGTVHIVRLADGTDTTVASGTAARFMDAGLVVLEGSELRLLSFGRLPQR